MRNVIGLLHCTYVGRSLKRLVHEIKWKTLSESPVNVEGSSMFCISNRKYSIFSRSSGSLSSDKRQCSNKLSVQSKDDAVIYYGALTSQIKGVKIFTCTSSFGGLFIQPILLQNIMAGENIPLTLALGTAVGFFTFVTPFLIHLLTKKYVTEIKYNLKTDTYTATTLSFFLQRVNVNFKLEDITIPNKLPIFTTVSIKGKPVFIVSDSFLEVSHYIRMMGYDKPIDLKLSVPVDCKDVENSIEKGKKRVAT